MEIKSKFKIAHSFKLNERGLIIVGDIIDGKINNEDFISFQHNNKEINLKIKSIESININNKVSKIALIFYYDNDSEKEILQTIEITEQIALISQN